MDMCHLVESKNNVSFIAPILSLLLVNSLDLTVQTDRLSLMFRRRGKRDSDKGIRFF